MNLANYHCTTYVKSCKITRAGLNGISTSLLWLSCQFKIFSTSFSLTWKLSQFLTAASNSTLIEKGSLSNGGNKAKSEEKVIIVSLPSV